MYMKRILVLLSMCVGLSSLAGVPLQRSHVVKSLKTSRQSCQVSPTFSVNASDMMGSRICLLQLYDWTEDAQGRVTVEPNDLFYSGGWSTTVTSGPSDGYLTLLGGFTMYEVSQPIKVDYATKKVTLEVGDEPFGTTTGSVTTTSGITTTTVDSTLCYYVVNEDWLVNAGPLADVTGRIENDGSIVIDEGFCFYIENIKTTTVTVKGRTQVYNDTTFSISLLMRNTRLQKPNGKHEYKGQSNGVTYTNDVYMRQSGDTVYVTNLYGLGWPGDHMILSSDGTMSFPGQPIADISDAENPNGDGVWYNTTSQGNPGNEGEVNSQMITWGLTIPSDNNTSWPGWYLNKLYFTDGSQFVVPGSVTVMRGDVNGDGEVSIQDVTALIDYLLGGDAGSIVIENADCNQDSEVGIQDVTVLIDYLLSNAW